MSNIIKGIVEIHEPADDWDAMFVYDPVGKKMYNRHVRTTDREKYKRMGYRDSPEAALKYYGIFPSKYKQGKFIKLVNNKWVEINPFTTNEELVNEISPDLVNRYLGQHSGEVRTGKRRELPKINPVTGQQKPDSWKVAAGKISKPDSEMSRYAKIKATKNTLQNTGVGESEYKNGSNSHSIPSKLQKLLDDWLLLNTQRDTALYFNKTLKAIEIMRNIDNLELKIKSFKNGDTELENFKNLYVTNKVNMKETHSTGTTAGSAGIGGGAGLGIEKGAMIKVLEKPFGEEVVEGQIYSTGGGAGQSYRKYKPKVSGVAEEQAPMFTPEEKLSTSQVKNELDEAYRAVMNILQSMWQRRPDLEPKNDEQFLELAELYGSRRLGFDEKSSESFAAALIPYWHDYHWNKSDSNFKESSIMKGIQNEEVDLVAKGIANHIRSKKMDLLSKYGIRPLSAAIIKVAQKHKNSPELAAGNANVWAQEVENMLQRGMFKDIKESDNFTQSLQNILKQNPKGSADEKMLLQRYIKTPMVQDFDLSSEEWIGQATKWLAINLKKINKNYPEVDTSDLISLATKMYEDFLAMQGKLEEETEIEEAKKQNFWANIHSKHKRVKHGSEESQRNSGSTSAPAVKAFRDSKKTSTKHESAIMKGLHNEETKVKKARDQVTKEIDDLINRIWSEEGMLQDRERYLVYSGKTGLEMDFNNLDDAIFAAQTIAKRNLDSPSLVYDRKTKYPVSVYQGSEDLWNQDNKLHEAGTRIGALNTAKQLYLAITQNQGSQNEIDLLQRQLNALMRKYNITFKDIGVKTPPMPAGQYVKWMPDPIEEGNPVDVWAIMGRGQMGSRGYIPPNLKTSEIPIDQIGSGGQTRLFVKRKVFRDIFSGYARTQALKADPNYGKDMRAMDFKKINQNVIDMAKQAGLEYDGTKWYYDIYSPITPNLKKHLIYLQDQFGDSVSADNKYKDAGIKKKSEKEEVKEYGEIDTKRKIEFSKENPPNMDELYRQFIQTMLAPGNTIDPQDWINSVNNTYGTRYTYKDYQSRGHKDYTNNWDKIVQRYILGKK